MCFVLVSSLHQLRENYGSVCVQLQRHLYCN
uniref:Uncharacterized protein n=1 Tax=Ciona intestinalis TaxID=7719 RepID=H2XKT9_CIOIN